MEKIVFKLQRKMEELSSQMKPSDYAQIQTWERFRKKMNEIADWINKHEKIMIADRDWLLARLELYEDKLKEHEKRNLKTEELMGKMLDEMRKRR